MRYTIHRGLKKTLCELHHGRKPRTELTNKIKDGKSFLSEWSELSILAPNQSKIPIYVGKDAEGKITNHMAMACTESEERQLASETKSPTKIPIRYPFNVVEKRHNRKSLEGRFQAKLQTSKGGTKNTVKTDMGKSIHRKQISGPMFQSEKRLQRDTGPQGLSRSNTEEPPLSEWTRWQRRKVGILRDILNGKLRIVQNKKRIETESEGDDDDDDEKIPRGSRNSV